MNKITEIDPQTAAEQVVPMLDEISPTMCMAKWLWSSIHLTNGLTNSCFLPPLHKIDAEAVKKNPRALHNTPEKKQQRAMMLKGEQPDGCSSCWRVEAQGKQLSDRAYRSSEPWAQQGWEDVIDTGADGDIDPTYLEVNFNHACNLACSYCSPHLSSKWAEDITANGPYPTKVPHNSIDYFKSIGHYPIPNREENPYVEAFWKWWEEGLKHSLKHLTLTGGEPLLSKQFWKVLDRVQEENLKMTILVNTNLCPPEKVMKRFLDRAKNFDQTQMQISTSIESVHKKAEYSRYGLDYKQFITNLNTVLEDTDMQIYVNFTNNALSFTSITDLVQELTKFKIKYGRKRLVLHSNDVTYPQYLNLRILPIELRNIEVIKFKRFMKMNRQYFSESEKYRFMRTLELALVEYDDVQKYRDQFLVFIEEYDKRRNLNFDETFPEIARFKDKK